MRMNRTGIAVLASSMAALAFGAGGGMGGPTYRMNPGLPRNTPPTRGLPVLKWPKPEERNPDSRAARRRRFKARRREDQRAATVERARHLSALKASRS